MGLLEDHHDVFVVGGATLDLDDGPQLVQHVFQQLVRTDVLEDKNIRVVGNVGDGELHFLLDVLDLVGPGGVADHDDFVGLLVVDLGLLCLLELVGRVPMFLVGLEGITVHFQVDLGAANLAALVGHISRVKLASSGSDLGWHFPVLNLERGKDLDLVR